MGPITEPLQNTNSPSELVEKIKESTSEVRDELEIREIQPDDVLHFVIKKENLKQRIKRKLTGKTEGKDKEKLKVSKELLANGIWAEIETETNHVWAHIKTTEEKEIIVRVAGSKSMSDDQLLGVSQKPMFADGTIVYLPSMRIGIGDKGKKGFILEATCAPSVVSRRAEGLVGLATDPRTNTEYFAIFDNRGKEKAEADGGKEIHDLRNIELRDIAPCDFYRLGEEPFVCIDVEVMGYADEN